MSNSKTRPPPCKRVAIIGGGVAGLLSIKALKEEGIEPVCFEKGEKYGGTWCYREKDIEGFPSVMSTTVINHSKEVGALSNYLFPKEYPNYMRHWDLFKYFSEMAEKFDLLRHITHRTEVVEVKKAPDYDETGKWVVTVKNLDSKRTTTDVYDGVMVCCGHIAYPKWPEYKGMETFKGKLMHTHSLKRFQEFQGKKVVIVGFGCSALDAAVEISSVAEQVYLSTRTPSYIISRVGPEGMPIDYCLMRRYASFLQDLLPLKLLSSLLEHYFIDKTFNHKLFGIDPKYPFMSRDPLFNDHIGSKILSGSVVIRKDVERIVEDGVYFEGEGAKTQADVIIFATGYQWKMPFLEDGIFKSEGNVTYLYKCMYPAQLKHHTLAFIGFILPYGPGFPIGELQARWAAQLFSGNGSLPTHDEMMQEVEKRHKENVSRYSPSDKMTVRVDYIPYADELASQFGAKPNFWKMMFTDPRLFISCIFGPALSYQYRLVGPHAWPQARDAILKAPERMQFPLSRGVPKKSWLNSVSNFVCGHAVIIVTFVFLCLFLYLILSTDVHNSFTHWMFSAYLTTIVIMFLKSLGDVFVNRSLWV